MRGAAENLDLPAIRADGADGDIGGGRSVVRSTSPPEYRSPIHIYIA